MKDNTRQTAQREKLIFEKEDDAHNYFYLAPSNSLSYNKKN